MRRLEEFSFQASLLARWWDWVILEMTPRPLSHFEVDFVDSLRQRPVLQKWRQLNAQFAQYTDVVGIVSIVQGSSLRSMTGSRNSGCISISMGGACPVR